MVTIYRFIATFLPYLFPKEVKSSTQTVLGTIHTDSSGNTVLHFQLRKETAKLNPELWLGR